VDESDVALTHPIPGWLAGEVVLLLAAEGIAAELATESAGASVVVTAREHARASRILAEEYPDGLAAAAASGPPRRTPRSVPAPADGAPAPEGWFGRASWVLLVIALGAGAIFVGEELAGGSEQRAVLLRFGATRPAHVRAGEWWRLVTALFVHVGPRHLLANLAALVVLGPALTAALGAGRFAFVYVVAGAAGNAASYLVAPSGMVSAGASGAILGVLGALGGQRIRFAASARYRGWQVVAALLAYLAIAVGAGPEVDTAAHLGGLVAGFALGLLVPPPAGQPSPRDRALSTACGAAALLLVIAAFAAHLRALAAADARAVLAPPGAQSQPERRNRQ
jgi:membrane associated rhomboid family serine protease